MLRQAAVPVRSTSTGPCNDPKTVGALSSLVVASTGIVPFGTMRYTLSPLVRLNGKLAASVIEPEVDDVTTSVVPQRSGGLRLASGGWVRLFSAAL